jgi:PIN like domain
MAKKLIAEKLRQSAIKVEIHDDHFPQNAADQHWIAEVGEKGWVVLIKHDRIRYRPAALAAYRRHKVRVFIFGSGEMKAQEMADAFLKALPKISPVCCSPGGAFLFEDFPTRASLSFVAKPNYLSQVEFLVHFFCRFCSVSA